MVSWCGIYPDDREKRGEGRNECFVLRWVDG